LGEFEANPHRQYLYEKMVEAGEELPPVVVRRVGNEFHILDGKHRVAAMKKGKVPETWVHEIEGSGLTGDDLNKAEKWTPNGLYHELIPVAHLESDFGRSTTHIPHPMGDWETPFGAVGMKPAAAWEEYLRSSKLQQLFPTPNPTDSEWFSIKLKAEPEMYNLIASSLFARLKARFGNTPKAVYAWRWGDGAASSASDEQVSNDEYVQKYAQKAAESGLSKSEILAKNKPGPKFPINKLHKLLDYLNEHGGLIHKNKIPKFPKELNDLLDASGNLSSKKIKEYIDEHASHKGDSLLKEELQKNKPTFKFPKLGLPDDRRETDIVSTGRQLGIKQQLIAHADSKVFGAPKEKLLTQIRESNLQGQAPLLGATSASYSRGKWLSDKDRISAPETTQLHENLHMMMKRVSDKHGLVARQHLAENLLNHTQNAIGDEAMTQVFEPFMKARYPGLEKNPMGHEERLATLLNYLNDPNERRAYHHYKKHNEEQALNVHKTLRDAYGHLQDASKHLDESWLGPHPTPLHQLKPL
jgi:hypothetical protein